jgi:membrane protein required for colicin V production
VRVFDTIGLGVLVVSTLIGFMRGASREVVNLLSLVLATGISVLGLKYTAPLMARLVEATWLAIFLSLVGVFAVVYVIVHGLGSQTLIPRNRGGGIGILDRGLGAGLGFGRGLVGLSALVLGLQSITPSDRIPTWISAAEIYPLTSQAASLIRQLAPEGMALAASIKPSIARSLNDGIASATAQDSTSHPAKSSSTGETRP